MLHQPARGNRSAEGAAVIKVVGCLFVAIFVGVASVAGAAPQSGQEVVIDGSKNPELFPEWFAWEMAFLSLGNDSTRSPMPMHEEIGVSKADLAILKEHARLFQEVRTATSASIRRAIDTATAQKKSVDEIDASSESASLDYRHKILDLAQRVTEQLSGNTMLAVRAWIAKLVSATTIRLRGRSIQFFKQPR